MDVAVCAASHVHLAVTGAVEVAKQIVGIGVFLSVPEVHVLLVAKALVLVAQEGVQLVQVALILAGVTAQIIAAQIAVAPVVRGVALFVEVTIALVYAQEQVVLHIVKQIARELVAQLALVQRV